MSNQQITLLLSWLLITMSHIKATLPAQPQHAMGTYVGELQERWIFTSDHLPIGLSVDGIHIVSWNVLDASCMGWVTDKNSQGLSRSKIAEEHIPIGYTKLTLRDQHNIDLILETIIRQKLYSSR